MKITAITNNSQTGTLKRVFPGWFAERYGDYYAQISVDTTLKIKSAVKDVSRACRKLCGRCGELYVTQEPISECSKCGGRVAGYVPDDIEQLTKKFLNPPQGVDDYKFCVGYQQDDNWIKGSSEPDHQGTDQALCTYIERYPEDWEIVKSCIGLPRQKGRHACAYLISNKKISSFVPLTSVGDVTVTAFTAPDVEGVGGLKMDFLVINSLRDIQDCIKLIQSRVPCQYVNNIPKHKTVPGKDGRVYDIWDLPEDQAVYADITSGNVESVFQLANAAKWLKHFDHKKADGTNAISSILDLAAFTALDRPGPLDVLVSDPDIGEGVKHNALVEYARRARGLTGSPDILPILEKIIPETYGILCFQEQLQAIYQNLTGCDGSTAEEFRTNVAKKKKEKVDASFDFFIENAEKKVGREDALKLWEFLKTWAQYGFNKSMDEDTILLTWNGQQKKIKDFVSGDMIAGVGDNGEIIKNEVVALHDHGSLEGYSVTFDDGYSVVVSLNHKFLTRYGQKPLHEIMDMGLEVLCEASANSHDGLWGFSQTQRDNTAQNNMHYLHSSKTREAEKKINRAKWKAGCQTVLRGGNTEETDDKSQRKLCNLSDSEKKKYICQDVETQQNATHASSCFCSCYKNVIQKGYTTRESCENTCLAKNSSGGNRCNFREREKSRQTQQSRGLVKENRNVNVARFSSPLRNNQEAGGFCQPGPKNNDRSGRIFSFFFDVKKPGKTSNNTSERRDIKKGSAKTWGCNVIEVFRRVFQKFGRKDARRLDEYTYSNAPLSSTGDLVFRKIIRVSPVGTRRMYDIEVSHPKHNFLLPNGIVTSNSHAASYSQIAYACAWLKYHYSLEWWCSVLKNAGKDDINDKFWVQCKNIIRLPDLQISKHEWTIVGDKVVAPIGLLHGVGAKAHEQISKHAPYSSIEDFANKIVQHREAGITTVEKEDGVIQYKLDRNAVSRSQVYAMIVAGVMDSLYGEELSIAEKLERFDDAIVLAYAAKIEASSRNLALKKAWKTATTQAKNAKKTNYITLDSIGRFQARKSVLPAYGEDMRAVVKPLVPEYECLSLVDPADLKMRYRWKAWNGDTKKNDIKECTIVDVGLYEKLEASQKVPNGGYLCAVIAYIEDRDIFTYHASKEAMSLTVDIGGTKKRLVMWPGYNTGVLSAEAKEQLNKGAVVALLLHMREVGGGFAIKKYTVIRDTLKYTVKEEAADE